MNADSIPWGLLFLVGARFLKYITDQITEPENSTEDGETTGKRKEIQYLVNGKTIDLPHHVYYLQILGLLGKTGITDSTVKQATKANYEIARGLENGSNALSDNIIAARYFLLDQWNYFNSVN